MITFADLFKRNVMPSQKSGKPGHAVVYLTAVDKMLVWASGTLVRGNMLHHSWPVAKVGFPIGL